LRRSAVILTARDRMLGESAAEKLIREGLDIEPFRLDLTRADEIAALVAHVMRHVKRIDVLVNNAGLYLEYAQSVSAFTSALTTQMDVVRAILEANLIGRLSLSQGLVGAMRD
jgi:NAD(P)-dependent dehydrogenase (short-subunit alcohol dehydrogenase family)